MDTIQKILGFSYDAQMNFLYSATMILLAYFSYHIIGYLFRVKFDSPESEYRIRKAVRFSLTVITLTVLLKIWLKNFQVGTFLGLLSAGLAIALKDFLVNIAGWIFITLRKPFAVGDRIEVDKAQGDVIDIRIFQFSVLEIGNWSGYDQSTGRIIHIPNGFIFSHSLYNYFQGFNFIWSEIPVLITFESNWQKAKKILNKIIDNYSGNETKTAEKEIRKSNRKFMIRYQVLTPFVYTEVLESGVQLTIRYLCAPRTKRQSVHDLWEKILIEFKKHDDIDFAYPTTRAFLNFKESKQKIQAKPQYTQKTDKKK
ncbi:MAG: mechanosensitive ion channel family protein [Leptospiraceae bacterium]|nr:mechanosensitive ion channel family protein [Leptospiraceae bacterium]